MTVSTWFGYIILKRVNGDDFHFFIIVSIDKRRRQRAETSESRRRNVDVNTYRNNRNTETGGKSSFYGLIIRSFSKLKSFDNLSFFFVLAGLLLKRESSRTELFSSTSDNGGNSHDDDRYDQLFIQGSRRVGDEASNLAPGISASSSRSNYMRNAPSSATTPSRNFFDGV